jgi:hypothetical protein
MRSISLNLNLLISIKRPTCYVQKFLGCNTSLLQTLFCKIFDTIRIPCLFAYTNRTTLVDSILSYYFLLLHGIGPVSLTFEHKQVNKLVVLLCLLCSDLLLHVLLSAISELKALSHAVELSDAVVMVSPIVVVTQSILVLG